MFSDCCFDRDDDPGAFTRHCQNQLFHGCAELLHPPDLPSDLDFHHRNCLILPKGLIGGWSVVHWRSNTVNLLVWYLYIEEYYILFLPIEFLSLNIFDHLTIKPHLTMLLFSIVKPLVVYSPALIPAGCWSEVSPVVEVTGKRCGRNKIQATKRQESPGRCGFFVVHDG